MYRTLRSIGAGSMGRVVVAEHTGLRRQVAVKLLSGELANDPAFVDRLRLEAQALAAVRHPNVVLVLDHGTTPGGIPFLVMELLQGRTLADLLQERGTIPLPEALHLLDQVFAGLAAVHAKGMIHRDLKPANIFLSEEHGRTVVKLLDFGIVKVHSPEEASGIAPLQYPTRPTEAIGTPRCMAPEQILGKPCDARTDVYAAGVLLYLLLAGRDPFHHHRSHLALFTAHVMESPPRLSAVATQAIPRAVDEAAARALSKDPARRFASMTDFGAALSATSGGTARMPAATPVATEKMAAAAWQRPAPRTTKLDAAVLRPSTGTPTPARPSGANGAPPATAVLGAPEAPRRVAGPAPAAAPISALPTARAEPLPADAVGHTARGRAVFLTISVLVLCALAAIAGMAFLHAH